MIIFDHVSYGYPDNPLAVQNVNLAVAQGENIAVIGANGAGKSTLLKLTAGLLEPKSGCVWVNGKNAEEAWQNIGYAAQGGTEPDDITILEYIKSKIQSCGYGETERKALTDCALKTLNLTAFAVKKLSTLSYGHRCAAAAAAVLAKQPSVMILDDPTALLDAKTRQDLINCLQTLRHTKIIATHDLELALKLCSKVIVLKNGSVYAYGSTQSLLRNVTLLEVCNLELPCSIQKYRTFIYRR